MAARPPAPGPPAESSTEAVAALVDGCARGTVVVLGSPPPRGRDLDLLVRPEDEAAIASALGDAGFFAKGAIWARFAECSAAAVELLPTHDLGLPDTELESLFVESLALPGLERLTLPGPHHQLLLAATLLVGRSGYLAPRHRERVLSTTRDHPDAWALAESRAREWRAVDDLVRLADALADEPPAWRKRVPALLRRARNTLRPQLIAISGIDGSGKSFQARALTDTLERLGYPAGVVWTPLANEAWLRRLARPVRRLVGLVATRPSSTHVEEPGRRGLTSNPARMLRRRSRVLTSVWTTIVALANGWSLARGLMAHGWAGRVVVADRYRLDSAVRMRFLYDERRRFPVLRTLLAALTPSPRRAFFLDVEPATSLARKDDGWSLEELAVQARLYREEHRGFMSEHLDGSRPPDDICAETAKKAWLALR